MKYLIKFFTLLLFIIFFASNTSANSKVKIGLVVPLSGENKELGESILKSVRLAINDIDDNKIIIKKNSNIKKISLDIDMKFINLSNQNFIFFK